jgi:hypothetical protein
MPYSIPVTVTEFHDELPAKPVRWSYTMRNRIDQLVSNSPRWGRWPVAVPSTYLKQRLTQYARSQNLQGHFEVKNRNRVVYARFVIHVPTTDAYPVFTADREEA